MKLGWLFLLCCFAPMTVHAQQDFLPALTGKYSVGRTLVSWTDPARANNPLEPAGPKRRLAVWIWYPASPKPGAQTAEWAPGKLGEHTFAHLPKQTAAASADSAATPANPHPHTHAYEDAQVSSAERKYPVVLFSPGLGQQPSAYAD